MKYQFDTIGIVHSCYKEKFAIPRQAGLVKHALARIQLLAPYDHPDCIKGLEGFSHLWISFVFHQHVDKGWKNLVNPPRVEGQTKYGVFATRSSFRPNPMGLSVVKLDSISYHEGELNLNISGVDFLDKTPVLDIKPYIEYSDSVPNTRSGFISDIKEPNFHLNFSLIAKEQIHKAKEKYPHIEQFITELLRLDHRPHYQKKIKQTFSSRVYEYDLQWHINNKEITVVALTELDYK